MSKIIKAVFTGRFCRTQRVFQFDTDDKLQIINVNLPANYTVDFSNSKTGDSVPVLATSDTVQIPPDLFVPGSEIYAWIWVSDSNGGHTPCEATIPIDPRARRTGTEPTPAQASAWDEAVDTLNETIEGIPAVVDAALTEAKESGEFDGKDGTRIWWTTARVLPYGSGGGVATRQLNGVDGATPAVRDYVFAPEIEQSGEPTTLYVITQTTAVATAFDRLCSIKGTNGTSPSVAITEIEGGHRITITDEAHPQGQSFDVMDGQGGGGGITVDAELSTTSTNPVQNKVVKAALDGKGTYSKPAGGIPKSDMAEDVQTSLSKADTALQQHQSLAAYRTAAAQDEIDQQQNTAIAAKYTKPGGGIPATDLAETYLTQHQDISGKLDKAQGAANAGKFLVVGSDGNITTVSMTAWQGGSY